MKKKKKKVGIISRIIQNVLPACCKIIFTNRSSNCLLAFDRKSGALVANNLSTSVTIPLDPSNGIS